MTAQLSSDIAMPIVLPQTPSINELIDAPQLETLTKIGIPKPTEADIGKIWGRSLQWYKQDYPGDALPAESHTPVLVGPGYSIDLANLRVSMGSFEGYLTPDEEGYRIFRIVVGLPFVDENLALNSVTPFYMVRGVKVGDGRETLTHPLVREWLLATRVDRDCLSNSSIGRIEG